MENDSLNKCFAALLIQTPVILGGIIGLVVSWRFRMKARRAASWAIVGFSLALLTVANYFYSMVAQSPFHWAFSTPLMRGISYLLLLVAVFSGRSGQTVDGSAAPLWQPVVDVFRRRPGLKSVFISVAVSVFLLTLVIAALISVLLPDCYAASTLIRLKYSSPSSAEINLAKATERSFIATEKDVLCSDTILTRVSQSLNLPERWGKLYNNGQMLKTEETLGLLKSKLLISPRTNSSVFLVEAWDASPGDAAEIANAVSIAYREYCQSLHQQDPNSPFVEPEVISKATPPSRPVRPNKPLVIAAGVWIGLWLAVIFGAGVVWLAIKFPQPVEPSADVPHPAVAPA